MSEQRATSLGGSLAEPAVAMSRALTGLWSCIVTSYPIRTTAGAQPALRLLHAEPLDEPLDGGAGGPTLSPTMTLTAFYREYFRPVCLVGAAPRNTSQYDESLGLWHKCCAGSERRTSLGEAEPALDEIDDRRWAEFRAWLAARPGRAGGVVSANTVRKHLIAVDAVLQRAGPRSRGANPQGCDLLTDPPRAVKPAIVVDRRIKRFALEEISAWLAVCHLASSPRGAVEPRCWWESAVLLLYNTGLRIGELLAARCEWLVEDEDGQWLELPPTAVKGGQRGRRTYLNATARLVLRRLGADRERLLPFAHDPHYAQALRRKLLARSTIEPRRRYGFHGLRKAFASELTALSPSETAVKMALGHAGDVTLDYYQHRRVMIEAMDRLPQPVWRPDRDGQQRLLF